MTGRTILGGFLFFFGSAALYAGFQAIDQPNPERFFRSVAWMGFILGSLLVGYGTLLLIGAA